MKPSIRWTLALAALVCLSPQARAYTGSGNAEAIVSFGHVVELEPNQFTDEQIQEQVADQVHYMFGPMSDKFVSARRSIVGGILGAPRIDDQERLFRQEPPFVAAPASGRQSRGPFLRGPIIRIVKVTESGRKR